MAYIIAIAGKGGTGKTTIAALLVRIIKEKKLGSVLAVDADPNSNLAEALGVKTGNTIGEVIDKIAKNPQSVPAGMTKDRFIEYQIHNIIEESDGFDVLTMGRPEGPGCYCYANNILRNITGKIIGDYTYVVIDNEAGLEHLSRRTMRSCDTLLVVSDASGVGLRAARRIKELVDELEIKSKRNLLLINSSDLKIEKEKLEVTGLKFIGNIPFDKQIEKNSLNNYSIMSLKNDAVSLEALSKIGDKLWN